MDKLKSIHLFFAFITTLIIGTSGYHFIEGWNILDSFFMTVITITTVGYREVGGNLSEIGKIFTSVLIFSGFGVAALALSHLTSLIIKGEINQLWGTKRMENIIKNMKDHYVIAGFGRTGEVVAENLKEMKKNLVVIESNEKIIELLRELSIPHIIGDASEEDILKKAGIEKASGFVAVVSSDAINAFAIMTARNLNPNLNIIARALDSKSARNLRIAGANRVIAPYMLGGLRIAQAASNPHATDFIDVMEDVHAKHLEIADVTLDEKSKLVGQNLKSELIKKTNILIVGIKKPSGEFQFQPNPDTPLLANDQLIIIGSNQAIENLRELS